MQKREKTASSTSSTSIAPTIRPSARAARRKLFGLKLQGLFRPITVCDAILSPVPDAARCRSLMISADAPSPSRARARASIAATRASRDLSPLTRRFRSSLRAAGVRSVLVATRIVSTPRGRVGGFAADREPQSQIGHFDPRQRRGRRRSARSHRAASRKPAVSIERDRQAADVEMGLDHVARRAGMGETMARSRRVRALSNVDFPRSGGPMIMTRKPVAHPLGRGRDRSAARISAQTASSRSQQTPCRRKAPTSPSSLKSSSASTSASASISAPRHSRLAAAARRRRFAAPVGAGLRSARR